jgi:thiol-disulfide isomerase/thioredoxin
VSLLSFEPRGGSSARISTDIVRKSRESSLEQTAAKSAESSPVPGSTALPAGRGGTASPSVPGEADSANATGGPSAAGPSAQQCTAESSSCGIGGEPGEQETSVDVAALTRGPRVIEFYKPDCPACLRMVPVLQGLHETCSGLGLDLVQLDVSLPENRAVAARLGVVGTPTLLFFDGTGQELSRLIGYQELDAVRRAAAILMGEQCAEFLPLD